MFTAIVTSEHFKEPAAFNMRKLNLKLRTSYALHWWETPPTSDLVYSTHHIDYMMIRFQFHFLDEECAQDRSYSFNTKALRFNTLILQLVANRILKKLTASRQQVKFNKQPAPCYSSNHSRTMYATKVETSNMEVKLRIDTLSKEAVKERNMSFASSIKAKPFNKSSWTGGPETVTKKECLHNKTTNVVIFVKGYFNVSPQSSREEFIQRISPKHLHWDCPSCRKCDVSRNTIYEVQEELDSNEDEEMFAATEHNRTVTKTYKVIDHVESLPDATYHRVHTTHHDERRIRSHGRGKSKKLTLITEVLKPIRTKTMERVEDLRSTNKSSVVGFSSRRSEVATWQFGRVILAASAQDFNPGIEITVAFTMQFFIHRKAVARAKPKGSAKQHLKFMTSDHTCDQPFSVIIGMEYQDIAIAFTIPITNVSPHPRHVLVGEVVRYLYDLKYPHDTGVMANKPQDKEHSHDLGVMTDKPRCKEYLRRTAAPAGVVRTTIPRTLKDQGSVIIEHASGHDNRFKDDLPWKLKTAAIPKNPLDGNEDKLVNLDPEIPFEYQERLTEVLCRNVAAFRVRGDDRLGHIKARVQTPLLPNTQPDSEPIFGTLPAKHETID